MIKENGWGKFVVFEGGPGAGKSDFILFLIERIRSQNWIRSKNWIVVREPGGTRYSELVRDAVQYHEEFPVSPKAALLGYNSARANLVDVVIRPSLQKGVSVLCDRYWFSTFAYQGAEGVRKPEILATSLIATEGLMPDLTLFFKVDPRIGQQRKHGQEGVDRYDVKDKVFFDKVMKNYHTLGLILRPKWEIIDASKSIEDVRIDATEALIRRGII